jgi:hypothetical protein
MEGKNSRIDVGIYEWRIWCFGSHHNHWKWAWRSNAIS